MKIFDIKQLELCELSHEEKKDIYGGNPIYNLFYAIGSSCARAVKAIITCDGEWLNDAPPQMYGH
jgi:hypothetical protein